MTISPSRRLLPALAAGLLVALMVALMVALLPPTAPLAHAAEVRTERLVVGTSVQGRDIVAHHRWREGARKRVLVIGSMHGDERAGTRVVRALRTARLPDNVDLWLVPTINPDGAAAKRRTNANGVDLNRNFPHRWKLAGEGTGKYSGPTKASEPETKALMKLIRRVNPRTTILFHQPLFGVDSYAAKSMPLVRALADEIGLPVRSFDCGGVCRGTATGWHNARMAGRAVTVEFGAGLSAKRLKRAVRAVMRVGSAR